MRSAAEWWILFFSAFSFFLLFVLLRCAQSKQQSWRWVWQRFMQIIKWVFKCIIKFRADAHRPTHCPLLLFRPMHASSLWLLAIIKVCPWAQHSPVYSMIAQIFKKLNTPLIKNMSRTTAWSECPHKCFELLNAISHCIHSTQETYFGSF